MSESATLGDDEDKPIVLKAIELVIAKPEDIQRETLMLLNKQRQCNPLDSDLKIRKKVIKIIIKKYSYFAAFTGGASGLAAIIPGLGQAVALVGGATGDIVLTMKFQIEMVMAIAVVHEHDIMIEEERRICFLIAGLGAINQAIQKGGKQIGEKAFVNLVRQYLKGATLVAVKEVFKKIGITFTRKALEKAIPFGVGMVIGASLNNAFTNYVGERAEFFFASQESDE